MKLKRIILNPVLTFVDWYVRNYHSSEYIHRDMIKDEIKERIVNAEKKVNQKRDEELERELDIRDKKHQIRIDGFLAEVERYKEEAREIRKLQKDLINLRALLESRAETLSIVIAQNKHEGKKIMNVAGEFIGQLDKIEYNINQLGQEFHKSENEESKILVE